MITENHVTVQKTARYYTLGTLNEHTRQVWIVVHGFRQTAKDFIGSFEPLANNSTLFVAPEALNRFYIDRQGAEVGATWMTREDRLNEIKDYVNYLDTLYLNLALHKFTGTITALGFSQGASTLTRWIDATQNKIDNAIVYAGEVAPELLPLKNTSGLNRTNNYYVCGTHDKYFTPERLAMVKVAYSELRFTEITFDGAHEINTGALRNLMPQL